MFRPLDDAVRLPDLEKGVLTYWREINAFRRSVELSASRPEFVFYDGPPFATGLPHYGHILAGTVKDVVTRYAHQTGHHVPRIFGWDTHGLPVEHEIDKTLGITDRQQILDMGVDKYNEHCRGIVMRYQREWESIIERTGRWIDFENAYKTMNTSFMESVWWVFKELWTRGLVYRGVKVMPFSVGCKTPLSNFEAGENYKDVQDRAISVGFKAVAGDFEFVAWTTTPWTLPSNLVLAVGAAFTYVRVRATATGRTLVLMKDRLAELFKLDDTESYTIEDEFPGAKLVGMQYEPLFPYFTSWAARGAFKVYAGEFVSNDSGTGIVHCAPGFGEDDFQLCMSVGLIEKGGEIVCPMDDNGAFTSEVTDWAGVYVKTADDRIIQRLKENGRLVKAGTITHAYPFCWRSDTPLFYRAVPSWFIKIEEFRDQLVANTRNTYWVPQPIRDGRFIQWLQTARDWAFSRSRYWGTPIPIWTDDDYTEFITVGSIAELEALSGATGINDLHMHRLGDLTIKSPTTGKVLRRIPEVFDCWFESGAMPFAQFHIPFSGRDWVQSDFVAEGLDQTRGWFYTLTVLSTLLGHPSPFKNLIVNGLILAEDGKKMSKRLKNYTPPEEIMDTEGADALRLYLINSPTVRAEPMKFKDVAVHKMAASFLVPWFNTLNFFFLQVVRHGGSFQRNAAIALASTNTLDRWILSRLQKLIAHIHTEMTAYRLYTVLSELAIFIDDMTNWYVRFNRVRMKSGEDWVVSLSVLFEILFNLALLMAPFTPFFAEFSYQRLKPALTGEDLQDSVHFLMLPRPNETLFDPAIERKIALLKSAVLVGRIIREKSRVPIKRPIAEYTIVCPAEVHANLDDLGEYIRNELHVIKLSFEHDEKRFVKFSAIPDSRVLGKRLGKRLPEVKKALEKLSFEFYADLYDQALKAKLAEQPPPVFEPLPGVQVNTDEVKLTREIGTGDPKRFMGAVDGEISAFADLAPSDAIVAISNARELRFRVQWTRKFFKLQPNDAVKIFVVVDGEDNDVVRTVRSTDPHIKDALGLAITLGEPPADGEIIGRKNSSPEVRSKDKEVVDVPFALSGTPFTVVLVRPN
jgi:isoleucyl-tRNA synthetase